MESDLLEEIRDEERRNEIFRSAIEENRNRMREIYNVNRDLQEENIEHEHRVQRLKNKFLEEKQELMRRVAKWRNWFYGSQSEKEELLKEVDITKKVNTAFIWLY